VLSPYELYRLNMKMWRDGSEDQSYRAHLACSRGGLWYPRIIAWWEVAVKATMDQKRSVNWDA
jgi:hypothetical protein